MKLNQTSAEWQQLQFKPNVLKHKPTSVHWNKKAYCGNSNRANEAPSCSEGGDQLIPSPAANQLHAASFTNRSHYDTQTRKQSEIIKYSLVRKNVYVFNHALSTEAQTEVHQAQILQSVNNWSARPEAGFQSGGVGGWTGVFRVRRRAWGTTACSQQGSREVAGEEVSIALLLQRLPDTGS